MTEMKTPYDAPLMRLVIQPGADGAGSWELEVRSLDAKGEKYLGYKARGDSLTAAVAGAAFAIKVHDELRDVWTEMPSSHRADVRYSMQKLLEGAASSLSAIQSAKAE